MTKFQKIQKFSSVIPFWSTVFVAIVTLFELKRRAASKKVWFCFILTFFLSASAVYLLNAFFMTDYSPLFKIIVSGLILAAANILFVDFQIISLQTKQSTPKIRLPNKTIILCCIVAGTVSIAILLSALLSPSVDIEDVNGKEDTSLAVIDINQILTSSNHYSAFSTYTSQTGTRSNVTGILKNCDYQECAFRCKKMSGIMTLQSTKTTCNQITLDIFSQLEEGNLEILIIIDGEYYSHVPINQNSSIVLSDIAQKTIEVKIAAESARFRVTIKRLET